MHRKTIALGALAVVLLFANSGCKALEKQFTPPPKVVTEDATMAVDGAQVAGELSDVTPEGLPLWPGAEVVESTGTEDSYGLTLVTGDPYQDVLNGVAAGFEQAGWEVARDDQGAPEAASVMLTIGNGTLGGFVTISQVETATTQIDYVITTAQ
jgi:hypothetical protein